MGEKHNTSRYFRFSLWVLACAILNGEHREVVSHLEVVQVYLL